MVSDDLLPLKIMAVLQKYTDENHTLTQAALGRLLEREYGSAAPSKVLRRVLSAMTAFDDSIEFEEFSRGGDGVIRTHFFLRHPFADSELRLLTDSLALLPHLPASQRADLLGKVRDLGSRYFEMRTPLTASPRQDENKQLFLNIELLDEAIRLGRKISAGYLTYNTEKKLCSRLGEDGRPRVYRLSPYRLLMNDGRYYLICNHDRFDDLAHYRIDRLTDIQILDEPARPLRQLDPARLTDAEEYIREHVYMFSGPGIRARLKLRPDCISEAVDLFGSAVEFQEQEDGWVQATVRAHPLAVCRFVRSYGAAVILETPEDLRRQIRDELSETLKLYGRKT